MTITVATDADRALWDDYVLRHPHGMPYQRWAWRQAVAEAYGHGAIYLLARSGDRVAGVLPLVNFAVPGRGAALISLPYCDVGGALAETPETMEELRQAAIEQMRQTSAKTLELRTLAAPSGTDDPVSKVLMLLDLPRGAATLLAGLKAKLRSQVNKPLRDGLHSQLGGAELVDAFYQVFSRNMRDLGSPVHSKAWIRSVASAYGDDARIGVVRLPDGSPVAAGMILLHGTRISVPWASSLRSHNKLNANVLLYWTFLSFAADHGFTSFDFGRSTPGEGTYRFKGQWGARPSPLRWVSVGRDGEERVLVSRPGRLRRGVESLWKQLPLPLCNAVGPQIRRHLSL